MQYPSHLAMALAGITVTQPWHHGGLATLIAYSGALLGALLPDIDHPGSLIGRRVPLLPRLLHRFAGHRGLTHSLLAVLAVYLLGTYASQRLDVSGIGAALAIGYACHLAGDMLTAHGVPLAWPLIGHRFAIPLATTGSLVEKVLVALWIAGAGYLMAHPRYGAVLAW